MRGIEVGGRRNRERPKMRFIDTRVRQCKTRFETCKSVRKPRPIPRRLEEVNYKNVDPIYLSGKRHFKRRF